MSHLYKCDNLHLNKEGNAAPSFNSSFHLCRLIEGFSQGNFCSSQPSFPCLIRNRSVFLWLNSPNSPRGETWNKRINYFKKKILSSLGIKLESENEKHRRSLAELRCFTEFSPWQFSLLRFQPCLTLVSLISSERWGEIDRWWGNKTSHSHHNALESLFRTYRQPKSLNYIVII